MIKEAHDATFFGSVLTANKDGVIFHGSYGLANMEHKVQNASKTKYRIGSLTKQFTALAILQLISSGKISLKSTLDQFILDYPHGNKITVHHLLSHTSGIHNFTNRPDFIEWSKTSPTVLEIIETFKYRPLAFEPGDEYDYSNSNYLLLSFIIELISGYSYEGYLRKNIFDVLSMNDTGYDHHSEIILNRASGYYIEDQQIKNAPYANMNIPQGAGGLYSTIDDLYKWDRGLYSSVLLNDELKTKMFTPNLGNYAYGWEVDYINNKRVLYHTGGVQGFSAFISRFVEDELCVITISNYSHDIERIGINISKMMVE